jgi:hypothetical protein
MILECKTAAYPIVQKVCEWYQKRLGSEHENTRTSLESKRKLEALLGYVEKCEGNEQIE